MNYVLSVIYNIGEYGPIILFVISLYLLSNKKNLFFYYTFGFFMNSILNLILKGIIQEPRPFEDIDKFNIAIKNAKIFIFKDDGIPFNIFGMPSGHTQSCLFSTIFIFFSLKRIDIFILYLFISLISFYQRLYFNYHTFTQSFFGCVIGGFIGYYFFYLSQQKMKGLIREKIDDYGPI